MEKSERHNRKLMKQHMADPSWFPLFIPMWYFDELEKYNPELLTDCLVTLPIPASLVS